MSPNSGEIGRIDHANDGTTNNKQGQPVGQPHLLGNEPGSDASPSSDNLAEGIASSNGAHSTVSEGSTLSESLDLADDLHGTRSSPGVSGNAVRDLSPSSTHEFTADLMNGEPTHQSDKKTDANDDGGLGDRAETEKEPEENADTTSAGNKGKKRAWEEEEDMPSSGHNGKKIRENPKVNHVGEVSDVSGGTLFQDETDDVKGNQVGEGAADSDAAESQSDTAGADASPSVPTFNGQTPDHITPPQGPNQVSFIADVPASTATAPVGVAVASPPISPAAATVPTVPTQVGVVAIPAIPASAPIAQALANNLALQAPLASTAAAAHLVIYTTPPTPLQDRWPGSPRGNLKDKCCGGLGSFTPARRALKGYT
jgi:hypothetical protein